jgi:hypothetical protein
MFDSQPPTLIDKVLNTIAGFFTWEVLGRAFFVLFGGGAIFLAVRSMLHGQFTFYARTGERAWNFIPPYVLIGGFFIYIGLRKKSLAEWNRESYHAEDGDKSEDESKSQPRKN